MARDTSVLKRLEAEVERLLAEPGGRRATKKASFTLLLERDLGWFERMHRENAMTWEGWAQVVGRMGLKNIAGEPYTARALKGAYTRTKERLRGHEAARAAPPVDFPAPRRQEAPASPPAAAASPPVLPAAPPATMGPAPARPRRLRRVGEVLAENQGTKDGR